MRLARPLFALSVVALLAGACSSSTTSSPAAGSSSTSTSSDGAAGGSDAAAYMDSLCTSIGDWQQGIEQGNQEFQQSITSGQPTPDAIKEGLQTYLQSAVDSTQALVADIEALGAPDIDGGDQVATAMRDAMNQVATIFQTLLDSVSGLDTSDPAGMAQAMQDLGPDLQEAVSEIQAAFQGIEGPDLDAIVADTPSCAALS